jgi:hypothetical protein
LTNILGRAENQRDPSIDSDPAPAGIAVSGERTINPIVSKIACHPGRLVRAYFRPFAGIALEVAVRRDHDH